MPDTAPAASPETTTTTTATPSATPPPAAPAKNKGGRPSNASKAAAAAAASAPAPTPAAKTEPAAPPAAATTDTKADDIAAGIANRKVPEGLPGKRAADVPKAKTLEEVRAARRAASEGTATNAPAPGATTETDKPKDGEAAASEDVAAKAAEAKKAEEEAATEAAKLAAEKAKTEPVATDVSEAQLAQFTKLNRDLRDARTKVKDLEAKAPMADKLTAALKLASEGKHYEAFKAAGLDFDAAAKQVLEIEEEASKVDPKLRELQEKIDPEIKALREKLAALEEGQTKTNAQRDAEAKAKEAELKEAGTARIVAEVTASADAFPFLSTSKDFVIEALKGADEAYPLLVEKLGRPLTDTEKNNLLKASLEEAEEQHAARHVLYQKASKKKDPPTDTKKDDEPAAAAAPRTIDSSVRGNITTLRPKEKKTLEQIKAERHRAGA